MVSYEEKSTREKEFPGMISLGIDPAIRTTGYGVVAMTPQSRMVKLAGLSARITP